MERWGSSQIATTRSEPGCALSRCASSSRGSPPNAVGAVKFGSSVTVKFTCAARGVHRTSRSAPTRKEAQSNRQTSQDQAASWAQCAAPDDRRRCRNRTRPVAERNQEAPHQLPPAVLGGSRLETANGEVGRPRNSFAARLPTRLRRPRISNAGRRLGGMFIRKSHRVRSCKIPSDALRRGARPQWRMAGVFGERTDTGATSSPASRDPPPLSKYFRGRMRGQRV